MLTFHIPEIHCEGCVRSLTNAVQALDRNATLTADLPAKQVTVNTTASREAVAEAFEDAGFDVAAAG